MKKVLYKNSQRVADILKILSHPERLAILCYIDTDKKNVSSIIEKTGVSQSKVSQHLNAMKEEGILTSKKEGRVVEYEMQDKKILELMKSLKEIFC